jgi:steroid 5-alpha reductase family enzyme
MTVIVFSLAACCLVMVLVWIWAVRIRNAGVVDIFWSYNFPLIALILGFLGSGYTPRRWLIATLVILAGVRLGTHLATRILQHIHEEEGRYRQLRADWAPHPDRSFFWFFQAQALSNVLLAIPFFVIAANPRPELSVLEYTGTALWLIAVVGEATADRQLQRFKNDPSHKGRVCDVGLWAYSRHPNYFFEWLMWIAYAVFALGSPYGYLGLLSPAIILYLLLRVTGIPATEAQSLRSKGAAYKAYQARTSAFIPWKRKNQLSR